MISALTRIFSDKFKILNAVLIVTVLVSAMLVVYSKHNNRLLFVELERLTSLRDSLNIEWGQLQLEQSTWATDSRIEKIATEKLGMKNVEYENTVIIKL